MPLKRLWPIHGDATPEDHDVKALEYLAGHFSGLASMASSNLEEAKQYFKQAKKMVRSTPFFSMDFKESWSHVPTTYEVHLT